jgi:hypothetical protein
MEANTEAASRGQAGIFLTLLFYSQKGQIASAFKEGYSNLNPFFLKTLIQASTTSQS